MKPKERTREEALKFLAEGPLQEIFNEAWAGLKYQNFEKCTNNAGHCLYNNGRGHHCVIGWINPYPGTLSTVCSNSFWSPIYLNASYKDVPNYHFLCSLQLAHDGSSDYNPNVKGRLTQLAAEYNLQIPE